MNKILLIGCGDIAMRLAGLLSYRHTLYGLVRKAEYFPRLRAAGIHPMLGDLDQLTSLKKLAGLADTVVHLAPPPAADRTASATHSLRDTRTRHLLAALSQGTLPKRLVYISTSGVYGDCKGDLVTELRPLNPQNARAKLRVDAESQIRQWSKRNHVHTSILRVPGIYANDRLPLDRLRKGTPAIISAEDGHTNHIHADDLAQIIVATLLHGKANRVYHTVDDSNLKMGDYFDAVADAHNLPRPPRITRAEAQTVLSPMLLSFMNESRQLSNARMKKELSVKLRYPTVAVALGTINKATVRSKKEAKIILPTAQLEMFPISADEKR